MSDRQVIETRLRQITERLMTRPPDQALTVLWTVFQQEIAAATILDEGTRAVIVAGLADAIDYREDGVDGCWACNQPNEDRPCGDHEADQRKAQSYRQARNQLWKDGDE